MQIVVNEQEQEVPDGAMVSDLLALLTLSSARVAVEVNRALVRRSAHGTHRLAAGDRVEIVTLVGGG